MAAPAFEAEKITKKFPLGEGALPILREVNLKVAAGEFLAIMGPSGSGKSTLLSILGCLEPPSGGTLRLFGQDVNGLNDDSLSALRARTLGFVFQAFHLLPAYSALANVVLGGVYAGSDNLEPRAAKLLEMMGLGHRLGHRPRTLSGGEKQRVAIARALINNPQALLADEPTGALDQKTGQGILDLLEQLHRQGKTLILVTHDPGVAARAQRVVQVVDGAIQRECSGRALMP